MATHYNILAWETHRQRSLVDYSPWSRKSVGHNLATKRQQNLCLPENPKAFTNKLLKLMRTLKNIAVFKYLKNFKDNI